MGHRALGSKESQPFSQHLAHHPGARRLLRLLQGDLFQRPPEAPAGQQGRDEGDGDGRGAGGNEGLLQPEQQHVQVQPSHVHGHTAGPDHAGEGEPAQHLGAGPLTRGL